MEVYIGTILAFGFNFPPRDWSFCNGSLQSISQNTALFALLGTYYGGDGRVTFALPNLQGRTAIGQGPNTEIGEMAGSTQHTALISEMPMHNHAASAPAVAIPAYSDSGSTTSPTGNSLAVSTGYNVYTTEVPDVALAPFTASGVLGVAGGSQPIPTMSPYLVLNYSIALYGIFPSRD